MQDLAIEMEAYLLTLRLVMSHQSRSGLREIVIIERKRSKIEIHKPFEMHARGFKKSHDLFVHRLTDGAHDSISQAPSDMRA